MSNSGCAIIEGHTLKKPGQESYRMKERDIEVRGLEKKSTSLLQLNQKSVTENKSGKGDTFKNKES